MHTYDIEIWKERFAEGKSKGLTVRDWCLENGFTGLSIITGIRLLINLNHRR